MLRKSVKHLQVLLNERCHVVDESISASELSHARPRLAHTAFIELLEDCVVKPIYNEGGTHVAPPAPFNDDREVPSSMRMRFIRIVLAGGEVEELATSLLDRKRYSLKDFKKLHYKR